MLKPIFEGAVPLPRIDVVFDPKATGLRVRDLALYAQGKKLAEGINFNVEPGQRIFLEGPSGCGKSTLLKALSDLHHEGQGRIAIPTSAGRPLHVPQNAYFPVMTMRGIICYPRQESEFTDEQITEAMTAVGMQDFIHELDNPERLGSYWEKKLSGGQQQKIVFARILLHKPKLLMVDEISSALDTEAEHDLYSLLIERLPDIMMLSISHHRPILSLHTHHAKFSNGQLRIRPITDGDAFANDNAETAPDIESEEKPEIAAPATDIAPQPGILLRFLRSFA